MEKKLQEDYDLKTYASLRELTTRSMKYLPLYSSHIKKINMHTILGHGIIPILRKKG